LTKTFYANVNKKKKKEEEERKETITTKRSEGESREAGTSGRHDS
jgi:hypothetical protein